MALRLPLLSPAAQFDASLREREEQTPATLQDLLKSAQRPETIEGYDCDRCRACCADGRAARSTITQHASIISALDGFGLLRGLEEILQRRRCLLFPLAQG